MSNLPPDLNEDQLTALRAGEPEAWRAVFVEYFPMLVDYATTLLRSAESAEDLVADQFAWLMEHAPTFAPRRSVRAYLLWLVHRRALNAIRGDRREQARYAKLAEDQSPSVIPNRVSEQDDVEDDILPLLDMLSPAARAIVVLRLRQDLEYDEIAAVMEMSRNAVKMQLSRALQVLRERYGEY